MSSGGRKYVLVYSAEHTGTWFLIRFLLSAYPFRQRRQCGEEWFRKNTHRGMYLDNLSLSAGPLTEYFFSRHAEMYIDEKTLNNLKLVIIHGHHYRSRGDLVSSLIHHKPEIPVCVPMRDPLLAVNTKMWRDLKSWENILKWETKDTRLARARLMAEAILELLLIPQEHVLLQPVDLQYSKEDKQQIGKDLCRYCGIPLTEDTQKYVAEWQPQNSSYPREDISPQFQEIKSAYRAKDMEALSKYLDVEMDYLNCRQDLVHRMEDLGYTEMIWW